MRRARLAVVALVGAAFLFGVTFVVIKEAVSSFPPLAFVGWRFLAGSAALLILAWPRGGRIWRDGAIAGVWLFAGYALQTAGLTETGASNSALITGLYVVFTPILGAVWNRRPPSPWVIVSAVVAFIGLALLTVDESLSLGAGDLVTLGCAVGFAGHIVFLSRAASRHPVVPFTAVQLLTVAAFGLLLSIPVEGLPLPGRSDLAPILLTGLGVSALAYLLQVWAQTGLGPGRTAVILTLEPVFGVLGAAVVLGERLRISGWVGAALILGAIELAILKERSTATTEAESVTPAH